MLLNLRSFPYLSTFSNAGLCFRLKPRFKYFFIFREENAGDVVNRKSDKKRRQNVYGIMQMPHQYDCAEKQRGRYKKHAKAKIFPKKQGEQKRKPGVR